MIVVASLYDLSTGIFSGQVLHMPDDALALNIPHGYGYVEGEYDYLSQRVDTQARARIDAIANELRQKVPNGSTETDAQIEKLTSEHDLLSARLVVDYQPQRPSLDHVWNVSTKRWQLNDEVAQRSARRLLSVGQIDVLEKKQLRAIRELALDPNNAAASAKLAEIEAQIVSLRAELT